MEVNTTVTMIATVLEVHACSLLVCDQSVPQKVLVHTDSAGCFFCGDRVCIEFNGAMTMSIPPQISARSITRIGCC